MLDFLLSMSFQDLILLIGYILELIIDAVSDYEHKEEDGKDGDECEIGDVLKTLLLHFGKISQSDCQTSYCPSNSTSECQ